MFSRGYHNLLLVLLSKTWSLSSWPAEGWWFYLLALLPPRMEDSKVDPGIFSAVHGTVDLKESA